MREEIFWFSLGNFMVSRFCFQASLDLHCLGVRCLGLDSSMSDFIVSRISSEHENNSKWKKTCLNSANDEAGPPEFIVEMMLSGIDTSAPVPPPNKRSLFQLSSHRY